MRAANKCGSAKSRRRDAGINRPPQARQRIADAKPLTECVDVEAA
jgi:hypothetical protein